LKQKARHKCRGAQKKIKKHKVGPLVNVVVPVVNGLQTAGTHSVTIKKNTLPAGVYVVGFKTGEYQESKAVVIVE
jgi:hypothetical protein